MRALLLLQAPPLAGGDYVHRRSTPPLNVNRSSSPLDIPVHANRTTRPLTSPRETDRSTPSLAITARCQPPNAATRHHRSMPPA